MTSLEKIKSRGYWVSVVHPNTFGERRIDAISNLLPLLEEVSVRLRGWPFPPTDERDITTHSDYIECALDHGIHVELWRFYQSGKFMSLRGIWTDWRDQDVWRADRAWSPLGWIGIREIMCQCIEVVELASRLSFTPAGDDVMHISVELRGMQGRSLYDDGQWGGAWHNKTSSAVQHREERTLSRAELVARKDDVALEFSREFLGRFGWRPPLSMLRDIHREVLASRAA